MVRTGPWIHITVVDEFVTGLADVSMEERDQRGASATQSQPIREASASANVTFISTDYYPYMIESRRWEWLAAGETQEPPAVLAAPKFGVDPLIAALTRSGYSGGKVRPITLAWFP